MADSIISSILFSNIIEWVIVFVLLFMIMRTFNDKKISSVIFVFLCVHIHQHIFCWRGSTRIYHVIVASIQLLLVWKTFEKKLYDVSTLLLLGAILHIVSFFQNGKSMLTRIC